jgi:hypothetical protein
MKSTSAMTSLKDTTPLQPLQASQRIFMNLQAQIAVIKDDSVLELCSVKDLVTTGLKLRTPSILSASGPSPEASCKGHRAISWKDYRQYFPSTLCT